MDVKTEHQSTSSEYTAEDLRNLEKVRTVMQALSKYIHGKKIYAKNNPTLMNFAKEFDAACQAYFSEEDEMVLAIDKYALKWRDEIAYDNDKRDESIAFLLYKDGIGEVSIQKTVTSQELEKFVDLIKDEVHSFSQEEDVVTKFWRSDFEHIYYRVLDEYLVGEFGEGRRGDADSKQMQLQTEDHPDLPSFADKGRVIVTETESVGSINTYLQNLVDNSCTLDDDIEREALFQNMMDAFFMISSEELKICQEEVSEENKKDKLVCFLDMVLEFTLLQDNSSAVRDVTNVIECIVDHIVAEAHTRALSDTLELVRKFSTKNTLPHNVEVFFMNIEGQLTDTSLLTVLGQRVTRWDKTAREVFHYFRAVGKGAVQTLCALLENVKGSKLHKEVCDTLITIARDDIPRIIKKLDMDRPRIAQDVVYLTRALDPKTMPEIMTHLVYYPDNSVREEVISFLADLGTGEAAALLVDLLDDPDKHIRLKTMCAIENMENSIVKRKINSLAFDKLTSKKGIDEQEHIFKALGRQMGADAVPQLRQMLEKKSLFSFGKGQNKQTKLLVIRALEQIQSPEATSILQSMIEDSNSLVKSKAQRALANLTGQDHGEDTETSPTNEETSEV